jgi:hypothetical protein
MLARDVWNETNRVTPLDNVIGVHVAHLRRKVAPKEIGAALGFRSTNFFRRFRFIYLAFFPIKDL